jgi:hypothetical protein
MKKIILTVFLLITAVTVFSQITITAADMPVAGKVNIVNVDTISHPNIGVASASPQNWNFSTLQNNYPQVASYSPVTPYQAYGSAFPGANLYTYGPSIMFAGFFGGSPVDFNSWGYMYWKTDAAGFHVVGFRVNYGVGDTNVLEAPQELLMGTPATYNSAFTDTSKWVCSFNKNPFDTDTNYIRTTTKTMNCDAYGSMTTTFGTFDVIRVHEILVNVDSVSASLGSITFYSMEIMRDTQNNYYFWSNDLGYPLCIVKADANDSIWRTEYLVDTLAGYTVTGTVYSTNGIIPIETGKVELIAKTALDELYGVPETVDLVTGGHFQFSNIINGGDFLVHAKPDTTNYPYNIPTYYGDSIYWPDAATLTVISDTAIVINTRNDSAGYAMTGFGTITGTIYQDLSGAKLMELSGGVKVTLEEDPAGITIRHTYTDAQGKYVFTDLPAANFKIMVDISAVKMDSTYYINYTLGDTSTANLDFYYDSLFIYIFNTASVAEQDGEEDFDVTIYPNPFSDRTFLYFTNVQPGKDCEVIIRDVTGRILNQVQGTTPFPVRIDKPGDYSGLLLYELTIDGIRKKTGKLVVY